MLFKHKISHNNIYFLGLILLAVALPFSNLLMSIAQIILFANWVVEGNLKNKFRNFLNNRTAIILSGVFFIHVAGLFYTSDWIYGLEDVKKKIPLMLLPLIISTSSPLSKEKIHCILKLFLFSVFISTLVSTIIFTGITGKEIVDIRQISVFISHIRFSLMICFSFFIAAYFSISKSYKSKLIWAFVSIWFFCFLILMESLTGLTALFLGLLILAIRWILNQPLKRNLAAAFIIISFLLIPPAYITYHVIEFYSPYIPKLQQLEAFSARGEKYSHNMESREIENGNYVRLYVAINELKETWNQRSQIKFDSIDRKGHYIEYTILRFLTSKGLRKDAEGVNALTNEEIIAIENGVANYEYQEKSSLNNRIKQVIWEVDWYLKGYNPTGHSFTMRLEFWRAAWIIIKENFAMGIGTGDAPAAFKNQYNQINTQLGKDCWHRSHNQFLAITVALGLIGLAYFIFSLIYPFLNISNRKNYFYLLFFIIVAFSMLSEDTLETQAGVTFFAYFNSLLLLGFCKKEFFYP